MPDSCLPAIAGVAFLGTGGKAGPTVSFSTTWSGTETTMDTTTEQATVTAQRSVSVAPKGNSCYELVGSMTRATQEGTARVDAIFSGYVGFSATATLTNWSEGGDLVHS